MAATVGEVSRVYVHKDAGRADVTFKYREDAKRAIQRYDRVTLDGRPMRVAMKDAGAAGAGVAPSGRGGPFSRDPAFTAARSSAPVPQTAKDTGTVFSVTMKGLSSSNTKAENGGDKKKVKSKLARTKNGSKDASREKSASTPVDAMTLDNDMDSYFAARTAAAKE